MYVATSAVILVAYTDRPFFKCRSLKCGYISENRQLEWKIRAIVPLNFEVKAILLIMTLNAAAGKDKYQKIKRCHR